MIGRERQIALALAVLVAADLRAVAHLRDAHRCAGGALHRVPGVEATLTLSRPGLRGGDDVPGSAVLSNTGRRTLRVRGVDAVLVSPARSRPLTWAGGGTTEQVDLPPGSVATVTFVLHTSRCRDAPSPLAPGFYEATLALRTDDGAVRAGLRAVVLAAN